MKKSFLILAAACMLGGFNSSFCLDEEAEPATKTTLQKVKSTYKKAIASGFHKGAGYGEKCGKWIGVATAIGVFGFGKGKFTPVQLALLARYIGFSAGEYFGRDCGRVLGLGYGLGSGTFNLAKRALLSLKK